VDLHSRQFSFEGFLDLLVAIGGAGGWCRHALWESDRRLRVSQEPDEWVERKRNEREWRVGRFLAIDAHDDQPPARCDCCACSFDPSYEGEVLEHCNHGHEVVEVGISWEGRIHDCHGRPWEDCCGGPRGSLGVRFNANYLGKERGQPAEQVSSAAADVEGGCSTFANGSLGMSQDESREGVVV